ncbi:hypothetical protein GX50_06799 [[Emmonsia] crescens]|uniref:Uncharacterized protein n=1 Tax=[Emmonsia] crescens TaxID=73230 RepID=A0A2B7ZA37_9EURO|nr:hypothetical protein GX50_06799 [Emmonsia crescens]
MASSSQRLLGESWASWSSEDADQSTCIDSDDEIYPEMDFLSSNPSTGPDNAVSFDGSLMQPTHFPQNASSMVSTPGPELIMPSIHEDYTPDGSWFVARPSTQAANPLGSRGPVSRDPPSRVPTESTRDNNNEKRVDQVVSNKSPSASRITDCLGNHRFHTKPLLLVGILLLIVGYLGKTSFSFITTVSTSIMQQPGPDAFSRVKPPRRYQLILDFHARLGQLLNPSNEAASLLPMLLKDGESEVVDLCGFWADDMGSKHELEFECNNALVVIRQARELIGSLFWRHGSVALDDIDRELARIKILLASSSVNEFDSLGDRIMAALNLHSKRPTSKQAISEAWYRQAETAFELAVSKQVNQISNVHELLNLFHTRLQPISEIVSNSRTEEEATRCGSHYTGGERDTSLASFLKNIRCTVEGSLTLLLPFSPKGLRPATYISGAVKQTIREKLRRADEKQQAAAMVANTLVTQLKDLQRDWERDLVHFT